MLRITKEGFEACLAFGAAALAFAEVAQLMTAADPDARARELLVELETAHQRLRNHFADGQDDVVPTLALGVVVLAERTANAIERSSSLPGS